MYCKPTISFNENGGRVSIMIGPKDCGDKIVENVTVSIPMPPCVVTHTIEPNIGRINFDEKTKVLHWSVPKIPKDKIPMLEGNLSFAAGSEIPSSTPSVLLQFNVTSFLASGLKIETLTVQNEVYNPFKGVKSFTRAGHFEIRT